MQAQCVEECRGQRVGVVNAIYVCDFRQQHSLQNRYLYFISSSVNNGPIND